MLKQTFVIIFNQYNACRSDKIIKEKLVKLEKIFALDYLYLMPSCFGETEIGILVKLILCIYIANIWIQNCY